MNIVEKIDKIRTSKGWSFYKLSQESNVAQQTLSKWMEGNTIPSVLALENICQAFGITMADLFAENGMIEATEDTKFIFENWNYLTKDEKSSIKSIVENYVNKNK